MIIVAMEGIENILRVGKKVCCCCVSPWFLSDPSVVV
jgi:hypothetical protein